MMCLLCHSLLLLHHQHHPFLKSLMTSVPPIITGTDGVNELDNAQWDANSIVPPQHTVFGLDKASVQNIAFVTAAH